MAQGESFGPGDVVQLKSGGPVMTVEEDFDDSSVICRWFEKNQVKSDVFKRTSLQRASQQGSGQTRISRG